MATKKFTLEELGKHKTQDDCWVAIHGKVYDITKFLPKHPGGFDIVLCEAGGDATEAFDGVTRHADTAVPMLPDWYIGDLDLTKPLPTPAAKPAPVKQSSNSLYYLITLVLVAGAYYTGRSHGAAVLA